MTTITITGWCQVGNCHLCHHVYEMKNGKTYKCRCEDPQPGCHDYKPPKRKVRKPGGPKVSRTVGREENRQRRVRKPQKG